VKDQNSAATLDGATYTYDFGGNRTSKTNLLNSATSNVGYDNTYQLTNGTGTTPESYTYDPVGNRLGSQLAATYSYNASNEVTAAGTATYTYDDNGNTLTKTDGSGTTTYCVEFREPVGISTTAEQLHSEFQIRPIWPPHRKGNISVRL
jgi:YD repeat-containing protein